MPQKADCSFCGKPIEPGTGLMFVRNDNQRFYFCSRKCERNLLHLRRRSRRIKWTKAYERGPSPPQPEKPVEEAAPEEKPKGRLRRRRKPKKPAEEEPAEEEPAEEEPAEEEPDEAKAAEEGKVDKEGK